MTSRSGLTTRRMLVRLPSVRISRTPAEPVVEPLGGGEHRVVGRRQPADPGQQRRHHPVDRAAHREQALHVAGQHVGQRQQPDRLGGGGAVDDHDVPLVGLGVALDVGQGEDLVEARARPTAPRPRGRRRRPSGTPRARYCWISAQESSMRSCASSCWPHSSPVTGATSGPSSRRGRRPASAPGRSRAPPCAGRGRRSAGRWRRPSVVLPTPPLPVNRRTRPAPRHCSRWALRWRSAALMIVDSARRFTNPGSGIASSATRW